MVSDIKQNDELKHYGVLGMKWGRRRATSKVDPSKHPSRKEYKKAKRIELTEKRIKDNDDRVSTYGKKQVIAANAIHIAATAYGTKVAMGIVKEIGVGTMKGIAQNPNMGNGALHVASALTVAGMGAVAVNGLKNINKLGHDIALTNDYDYRQYQKKMAKKKK